MKNRFKMIRQHTDINLSQEAFGKRLGVTGAAISRIESGNREPSEQIILAICREFDVNEMWLRTGKGDMFIEKSHDEELAGIMGDILSGEDDFRKRFLSVLMRMKPEEWRMLEQKINELSEQSKTAAPAAAPAFAPTPVPTKPVSEPLTPGMAAELAELKRQNKELTAKVAALEEEDALLSLTDVSHKSHSVSIRNFRPVGKVKK